MDTYAQVPWQQHLFEFLWECHYCTLSRHNSKYSLFPSSHEDLPVPPSKKSQKSGIGKGEGNEHFDRGVAAAGRSSGVMGDETAGLSSFGVELDATVAFLVGVHISGLEFTSCS